MVLSSNEYTQSPICRFVCIRYQPASQLAVEKVLMLGVGGTCSSTEPESAAADAPHTGTTDVTNKADDAIVAIALKTMRERPMVISSCFFLTYPNISAILLLYKKQNYNSIAY